MRVPPISSSSLSEPDRPNPEVPRGWVRLSQTAAAICYWVTMACLAIATSYLAYLTLGQALNSDGSELSWGASTPRWMIDCLPLFVSGICLGEASYSLWQGRRSWKQIWVGVGFLALRGIAQWIPVLAGFPHH